MTDASSMGRAGKKRGMGRKTGIGMVIFEQMWWKFLLACIVFSGEWVS